MMELTGGGAGKEMIMMEKDGHQIFLQTRDSRITMLYELEFLIVQTTLQMDENIGYIFGMNREMIFTRQL